MDEARPLRAIQLDPTPDQSEVPPPLQPSEDAGETTVTQQRLDQLSSQIRHIYILSCREAKGDPAYGRNNMAKWDGGVDSYGRRTQPIWPRIAAVVAGHGVDPVDFIRAQFVKLVGGKIPFPNQMYGHTALQNYYNYASTAVKTLEAKWEYDMLFIAQSITDHTAVGWDYPRAVRYALNDKRLTATVLLRYCLAVKENQMDVAAFFYESALLQYVFQKEAYDRAWGARIPDVLRLAGEDLRARLIGG